MDIRETIDILRQHDIFLFFLQEERFLDLAIASHRDTLAVNGMLDDSAVQHVIHQLFQFKDQLPGGMYFPIPMARELRHSGAFDPQKIMSWYYEFIFVDRNQQWSLKNQRIEGKVFEQFVSNLNYEPEIGRYYVEYYVESRWDKCYLQCERTPMRGLQIQFLKNELPLIALNNGRQDTMLRDGVWLDADESCLVQTTSHGEILLADMPRFLLLDRLNEEGTHLVIDSVMIPVLFRDYPETNTP
ncbi:MAG: hypothetical protein HQM11_03100 [SAR324 cluster bacterium]|nr:hypothetical protein [SAR324 cluster bacterium]